MQFYVDSTLKYVFEYMGECELWAICNNSIYTICNEHWHFFYVIFRQTPIYLKNGARFGLATKSRIKVHIEYFINM